MKKSVPLFTRASFLAVGLAVLIFGVALAVNLGGWQIDFLGVEEIGNNTTRWTYAVTEPPTPINALSHWVLAIGECGYTIISPTPADGFTTLTGIGVCSDGTYNNCEQATYDVVWGYDGSTLLSGIKFESPNPPLAGGDPPSTHIFQFDLWTASGNYVVGVTDAAVKFGDIFLIGDIDGPWCDPSAVSLVSFDASSDRTEADLSGILLPTSVAALIGGGVALIIILRLRRKRAA